MQILAEAHYTKIFKCGLGTKCLLYAPNTLWPDDAICWVGVGACVVGQTDIWGAF